MQKQAPSIGRILVAVGFALSCFALLLFLWVTFGGPVPFKPQSYRFSADFPEAITLQKEADVRVGGVSVGKVKSLELPPEGDATRAVIEIDPQYAPISSDAEAILRQKTLLGETYVELTTGTQDPGSEESSSGATAQGSAIDVGQISGDDAPHAIPEGGHLESTQVADQTQIDEIFNGFDEQTRQAFQLWMKNSGVAVNGRGLDLNDAFGNIGPFSADASDVLATLRRQEEALKVLVRNTGTVFEALTARDQALAGAIVGTNRTFRALASRDDELAETFTIFPTFNMEARLTLDRLEDFARNAGPLFNDLKPVARDISPTIRDLRRLAPHARRLFNNLDPLIKASATGLPALRRFLDALRPVMVNLDPFLANFNPIVRYLDYYAPVVTDFLANPAAGTAGALPPIANQTEPRHLSRQLSNLTEPNAESLSVWSSRIRTNRGNGYLLPLSLASPNVADQGAVFPNFDCENTQATGGLGSGMVTPEPLPGPAGGGGPASTPPTQEGVYPFSSAVLPALGGATGLFSDPLFDPLPDPLETALETLPAAPTFEQTAFATCVTQTWALGNFPAAFGGGRLPQVLADP
jgi:phospholipid/cholesterol/gamma-HCH transport system substrate-binding protein